MCQQPLLRCHTPATERKENGGRGEGAGRKACLHHVAVRAAVVGLIHPGLPRKVRAPAPPSRAHIATTHPCFLGKLQHLTACWGRAGSSRLLPCHLAWLRGQACSSSQERRRTGEVWDTQAAQGPICLSSPVLMPCSGHLDREPGIHSHSLVGVPSKVHIHTHTLTHTHTHTHTHTVCMKGPTPVWLSSFGAHLKLLV